MFDKLLINTNPNLSDLNYINSWLVNEYKTTSEGFYCNWSIIKKSFHNEQMITLIHQNQSIGFVICNQYDINVYIEIFEIHPEYRYQGLGKTFIEMLCSYFKAKNFVVFNLNCALTTSKGFWERIGFQKFPLRGLYGDENAYFKPLIKTLSCSDITHENTLQLWDKYDFEIDRKLPKWIWNFDLRHSFLELPIIFPFRHYWHIRWVQNGEIIKEGSAKDFNSKNNLITFGNFLYITRLIND